MAKMVMKQITGESRAVCKVCGVETAEFMIQRGGKFPRGWGKCPDGCTLEDLDRKRAADIKTKMDSFQFLRRPSP